VKAFDESIPANTQSFLFPSIMFNHRGANKHVIMATCCKSTSRTGETVRPTVVGRTVSTVWGNLSRTNAGGKPDHAALKGLVAAPVVVRIRDALLDFNVL
jgi:hypothetical protein